MVGPNLPFSFTPMDPGYYRPNDTDDVLNDDDNDTQVGRMVETRPPSQV